jgi:F0F1-type ATP synthase membrane subunit c/vacuolar-type H+-ATPase subunit K
LLASKIGSRLCAPKAPKATAKNAKTEPVIMKLFITLVFIEQVFSPNFLKLF